MIITQANSKKYQYSPYHQSSQTPTQLESVSTSSTPNLYIPLNNKRKGQQYSMLKCQNQQCQATLKPNNRNMVRKLSIFIQKIQETMKTILSQKDIKWCLTSAHTTETQLIDSISNSLNKFKQLLYFLKDLEQKQSTQSKGSQVLMRNDPLGQRQNGLKLLKYGDQALSVVQTFDKNSFSVDKKGRQRKVNYQILDFFLRYFNDHMIAQTHWSNKILETEKEILIASHSTSDSFGCKLGEWTKDIQSQYKSEIYLSDVSSNELRTQKEVNHRSSLFEKIKKKTKKNDQNLGNRLPQNQERDIFSKPVQETIDSILKIQDLPPIEKMQPAEKIAYLFDLESKMIVSAQFLEGAVFFENDITTSEQNLYANTWQFINENNLGDQKAINKIYRIMKIMMTITNASVVREKETYAMDNILYKKIVFGLSFPRYFCDFGRAKLQNQKFLRKPTIQTAKSIWNLPETWIVKEVQKPLILQSIKTNLKFYLPRSNSKSLKGFKLSEYPEKMNIFKPNPNWIQVRLLNHNELFLKEQLHKQHKCYETVIVHMHGGGFIALSSGTMQSYTRRWANSLKVPVFSIDYGKPPEHRFPTPVLDCLEAYQFITTQIHKYVNIRPKRIILAGDSAGGNLACALTALIMKFDLQQPDGLFLAYPAVDTRISFSPSKVNSFTDVVLYPTLLLLCMKEYLGDVEGNQNNPLASPLLLTQSYVSNSKIEDARWPLKWPKTIISVGKKDPLFDDSLRMCQRMASSDIEFHCEIYKNLSHAFMSMDKIISECDQTIKDSIVFLDKLIKGEKIAKKKLL